MRLHLVTEGDESGIDLTRTMFREYADGLGVDLCFQDFDQELAELPGKYRQPEGILVLLFQGDRPAACGAVRPLSEPGDCEMKRLYVRDDFRGTGYGRILAQRLIDFARDAGYKTMRLDTLRRLGPALKLYRSLGFTETSEYTPNPEEDVVYMELSLA